MRKMRIKGSICLKYGCGRCELAHWWVPEDCKYAVLHMLEDDPTFYQRRRSGKTWNLIRMALERAEKTGERVIFLTATESYASFVRNMLPPDCNLQVMTTRQLREEGNEDRPIFSDEVQALELDSLHPRHKIIHGHATP